ncbi:MAG TPA: hypothetical protein VF796_31060 [Humisphaera sp.]
MYEDDEIPDDRRDEAARDPAARAQEKADEFRMHAERAAVYEGHRKFDFEIRTDLSADAARDVQRRIAKLEKSKAPESPILPPASVADAAALLDLPGEGKLAAGDYHVHRRPGEVMIVRWLAGEQVDTFYARFQAHFDAALEGFKEDEEQAHGWKQDNKVAAYLKALGKVEVKTADRYLRDLIKTHNLFVLSTQTADEMDILHLADTLMGVPAAELVGAASAPPDEDPTERDRAWFFKLFSLRGMKAGVEQMCFFTYLQKAEDTFDLE